MTFESNDSMEIGWWFEALVFRSFLKRGLTFASLKAPMLLLKGTEKLQISEPGFLKISTTPFKSFLGSLSMPAGFNVSTSLKIFNMRSFSVGSKSNFLVIPKLSSYRATESKLYLSDGLGSLFTRFSAKFEK